MSAVKTIRVNNRNHTVVDAYRLGIGKSSGMYFVSNAGCVFSFQSNQCREIGVGYDYVTIRRNNYRKSDLRVKVNEFINRVEKAEKAKMLKENYLVSPEIQERTREVYIIGNIDPETGSVAFSKKPVEHNTEAEAKNEALRLATVYGLQYVVFKRVASVKVGEAVWTA